MEDKLIYWFKLQLIMDFEILEEIGLTKGEIKVYLSLLKEGPSTAGRILESARVQNSVFHFCINRLIHKGLVSYTRKNKSRVYAAASPDAIVQYLKNKENKVKEIVPDLCQLALLSKPKQSVELFEGIKGVMTMLSVMIEGAKKGEKFYFFAPELENSKEVQKFYEQFYDIRRKEKGLITKGIAPISLKKFFEKRKNIQMKYIHGPVPSNSSICNGKMALISWSEKPIGILIIEKQLVQKHLEFFENFWQRSK